MIHTGKIANLAKDCAVTEIPMRAALTRLSNSIGGLQCNLENLVGRLECVRTPRPPTPDDSCGPPKRPSSILLDEQIDGESDRIDNINALVNEFCSQLRI